MDLSTKIWVERLSTWVEKEGKWEITTSKNPLSNTHWNTRIKEGFPAIAKELRQRGFIVKRKKRKTIWIIILNH